MAPKHMKLQTFIIYKKFTVGVETKNPSRTTRCGLWSFLNVFYKMTICSQQPPLRGTKSGHLVQVWQYTFMWEKALLSGTGILYPEGFFQLGASTDSKNKTSAWLVPRFHTGSKQHFFRSSFSSCIGLFQKKTNKGVEDMEFPGVLKKEHVEIPGVN